MANMVMSDDRDGRKANGKQFPNALRARRGFSTRLEYGAPACQWPKGIIYLILIMQITARRQFGPGRRLQRLAPMLPQSNHAVFMLCGVATRRSIKILSRRNNCNWEGRISCCQTRGNLE